MAEMKNQKLLNKALNLLPDLVETKVDAVQTVELYKNDNSIVIEQAVDYRKRVLKKGSRVCLDFGNHQVGYLTLNLNYRGSHPDAPVWLKLHFAENATELFEDGKIKVKNASGTWKTTESGIDIMALKILSKMFDEYQETGKVPEHVSWFG